MSIVRRIVIRGVVLCSMALGLAYVSVDGATTVMNCSDLDFGVCMEGWECQETADCEGLIGATGSSCVVAEAKCEWHWSCIGMNPRLTCKYGDDPL